MGLMVCRPFYTLAAPPSQASLQQMVSFGGFNQTARTNNVYLYNFGDETVTYGVTFLSIARWTSAAISSSTTAICVGGNGLAPALNSIDYYQHGTNSITSSIVSALPLGRERGAINNTVVGEFVGGIVGSSKTRTRFKYEFGTDTFTSQADVNFDSNDNVSYSTATDGYFYNAFSATLRRITFASDTTITSYSVGLVEDASLYDDAGVNNSVVGVLLRHSSSIYTNLQERVKFTFAPGTITRYVINNEYAPVNPSGGSSGSDNTMSRGIIFGGGSIGGFSQNTHNFITKVDISLITGTSSGSVYSTGAHTISYGNVHGAGTSNCHAGIA